MYMHIKHNILLYTGFLFRVYIGFYNSISDKFLHIYHFDNNSSSKHKSCINIKYMNIYLFIYSSYYYFALI